MGVDPRVDRLVADRVALGVGEAFVVGSVPRASVRRSPLIWRGVCPWDKSAITRQRRTSSRSNRCFLGRRLAARAALPASSARYAPSGPACRAISRHTTKGHSKQQLHKTRPGKDMFRDERYLTKTNDVGETMLDSITDIHYS